MTIESIDTKPGYKYHEPVLEQACDEELEKI